MAFRGWKRAGAAALAASLALTTLTGFRSVSGFGDIYYESNQTIFDGVTYTEMIGQHAQSGAEHAYAVTADFSQSSLEPMVFCGEVRGVYTVASMIKYVEEQGYKVVAAINGDIYDTSSGTPRGPVIHDGNLVTGGYAPDRVVAFDKDGKASLQYVGLKYSLTGTIEYDTVETYETTEPAISADGDAAQGGEGTQTAAGTEGPQEGASDTAEGTPEGAQTGEEGAQTGADSAQTGTDGTQNGADYVTVTHERVVRVQAPLTRQIDFFNVPHGGSNGLHLFNRHYASSTKTSGSCAEAVIRCDDIQLAVNKTIKGTVISVDPDTCNTPITDNTIVLSTRAGSASYNDVACLLPGSEIEISVTDTRNTGLADADEALGFYYSILENGVNVTNGAKTDPRTGFGIKDDGSVILYEVDGRQTYAKGLSLVNMARHMKELGCSYAFNMDGGGSSVLYARLPGQENSATLKSSPSGGSQRSVANAILFVYKETAPAAAEHLHIYPAHTLMMPGASVKLDTFASNRLYEKAYFSGDVSFSLPAGYGSVVSGVYTAPKDMTGSALISASAGNLTGSTTVEIVDDLTFTPSTSKLYLQSGQTADIDITAKYGSMTVRSDDTLFAWSCDESIGTIDEKGVFTATDSTAVTGEITVTYGEKTITVPVQVGPLSVDFSDTKSHWARSYIGSLAARRILNGMGNDEFMPDATLTRAQFLTMLSKLDYSLDVSTAKPAGFEDVAESDWFFGYVNWGYENGIVSGMDEKTFAPNAGITREQMAVMLCNYCRSIELALPQTVSGAEFTDAELIASWSADCVATVVGAGIMNGMDDQSFQPQGTATRAQAAKVVYMLMQIRDGISDR